MLYSKAFLMMRILMNTHTRTDIFTYIFALRCKDWVCGIQFKVLLSHYLTTNSCAQKNCHLSHSSCVLTCHRFKKTTDFVHLNMPKRYRLFFASIIYANDWTILQLPDLDRFISVSSSLPWYALLIAHNFKSIVVYL